MTTRHEDSRIWVEMDRRGRLHLMFDGEKVRGVRCIEVAGNYSDPASIKVTLSGFAVPIRYAPEVEPRR